MSLVIDGESYTLPEDYARFRVPITGDTTWPYRRNRPNGIPETDAVMQQRVQLDVIKQRQAIRRRAEEPATPASSRPLRQVGSVKGNAAAT